MIKLDYSLETPEERNDLVNKILAETPNPSEKYLEILSDYLVLCMEKQEKKQRKLLTDNRLATVTKRETSLEGLCSQLENGEDGIYNLMSDENKNAIFKPKISITKKDIEEIADLQQALEAIAYWEKRLETATGRDAYIIKQAIIEFRKDQYIIKNAYRKPIILTKITHSTSSIPLDDDFYFNEDGYPMPIGISLLDAKIISAILCNYSKLKADGEGEFHKDLWFLMEDFDKIAEKALLPYPLYERIVEYKIDGLQNIDIQEKIQIEFGIKHSLEYISSLWRNKIPKLIAAAAEDEVLDWYYLSAAKGKYKRCSRCGKIKLAHNKYFSKNRTSRDGFYSICKSCRNRKIKS